MSAGLKFRQAVANENPLQVVGTINANHALLAKRAGFKAIYLSGGGVAAENVYNAIRADGTQKNVIDIMQTRAELYERINYHQFEAYLDNVFKK